LPPLGVPLIAGLGPPSGVEEIDGFEAPLVTGIIETVADGDTPLGARETCGGPDEIVAQGGTPAPPTQKTVGVRMLGFGTVDIEGAVPTACAALIRP